MNDFIVGIHKYLRKHRYILIGATVLFTILTLSLTLLPIGDIHLSDSIISHDKLGHFLLFGGWTFLIGYYRFSVKPEQVNWILVLCAGIVFGGCVELLQGAMPFHRSPDPLDWLADSLGAFCAVTVLYFITRGVDK